MVVQLAKHTKKIIYSFLLASVYLTLNVLQKNAIYSFIITLNIFYFSREYFYSYLFIKNGPSTLLSPEFIPQAVQIVKQISMIPISDQESSILPSNIKQLLLAKQKIIPEEKQTERVDELQLTKPEIISDESVLVLETSEEKIKSKVLIQEQVLNDKEELLITALLKAEKIIDEKIQDLVKKRSIQKIEVKELQEVLKEPINVESRVLKEKMESWVDWQPLSLHEKLVNQEIYCEKCKKSYIVQDMIYEITKDRDYYEVVTIHGEGSEKHTNITRMTNTTYEILSKPILIVKPVQEVEA
jgi:hypothetical protein